MKNMQYLSLFVLFIMTLTTSANQLPRFVLIDKLDTSHLNFPTNYFDEIPQINQYTISQYENFEALKKVPTIETREDNISYIKNRQMASDFPVWLRPTLNEPHQQQAQVLTEPLIIQNRGFPISSVYFDMVKGTMRKLPTEVPIDADDISFGPSASQVRLPKHNLGRGTHFYKTEDKIDLNQVTSHKINENEDKLEHTTVTSEYVSTSTIPPVPTLSPWLDGYGK